MVCICRARSWALLLTLAPPRLACRKWPLLRYAKECTPVCCCVCRLQPRYTRALTENAPLCMRTALQGVAMPELPHDNFDIDFDALLENSHDLLFDAPLDAASTTGPSAPSAVGANGPPFVHSGDASAPSTTCMAVAQTPVVEPPAAGPSTSGANPYQPAHTAPVSNSLGPQSAQVSQADIQAAADAAMQAVAQVCAQNNFQQPAPAMPVATPPAMPAGPSAGPSTSGANHAPTPRRPNTRSTGEGSGEGANQWCAQSLHLYQYTASDPRVCMCVYAACSSQRWSRQPAADCVRGTLMFSCHAWSVTTQETEKPPSDF